MESWKSVVERLIGKPFKWNGRGPDAYDCWGLVETVLREMNIPSPSKSFCVLSTDPGVSAIESSKIMEEQFTSSEWRRTEEVNPGVVLAMSTHRRIHHVGIVTPFGVLHVGPGYSARLQSIAQLKAAGFTRLEGYKWVG